MNEKVNEFKSKNAKSHPCGEKSFWDHFKKKTYIKDLDGKILYEGRGSFQKVLERAVKEGVELPKADLRNKKFKGIQIPNAKLRGASFENSQITYTYSDSQGRHIYPDLSNSDLREVSFKNTLIDRDTKFKHCDVEKADFNKHNFFEGYSFSILPLYEVFVWMKNFDKAYNIRKTDLEVWQKHQPDIERRREAEMKYKEKEETILNPDKDPLDQVIKDKRDEIKKAVEAKKQKLR